MGKFQPKRRRDHSGKQRNNYYRKDRTKYTRGHIHDQIGIGVTIVTVITGTGWRINYLIGNLLISSIITTIVMSVVGYGIWYFYKKF